MQPPPTVLLAGDIDEQTYPGLIEVLATVARTGERRIRVDLADVGYCDLAGLRAIIALTDSRGDGRRCVEQVILAHVPGFMRTVLRVLGWGTAPGLIVEDEAF
jgi:anti-anti-sigma regulatory factor